MKRKELKFDVEGLDQVQAVHYTAFTELTNVCMRDETRIASLTALVQSVYTTLNIPQSAMKVAIDSIRAIMDTDDNRFLGLSYYMYIRAQLDENEIEELYTHVEHTWKGLYTTDDSNDFVETSESQSGSLLMDALHESSELYIVYAMMMHPTLTLQVLG